MSETLILVLHHDLAGRSKANAALADAARGVPGASVVDMGALYPSGAIDWGAQAEAEAARLLGADRLVLQFPLQWYSTPPLLKAWQDAVLTRMYYIHTAEGDRLGGLPLMLAATAGNVPEAYGPDGGAGFPLDEVLTPLKATAHRCGWPWHPPFVIYRADELDRSELYAAGEGYAQALAAFADATPARATEHAA